MKRITSFLLVLAMLVSMMPTSVLAAEASASGECGAEGDSVFWTLDTDGIMTITGSGRIFGFPEEYKQQILTVIIEEGVTAIGASAFSGCSNLRSITIPGSVQLIYNSAFQNCSSLTTIDIPYGVSTIFPNTFTYCTSLTSITIPSSVTTIGGNSFFGCSSLETIAIPNGVTEIGDEAFAGCSLKSVTIPESVEDMSYAFHGCTTLSAIEVAYGNDDYCSMDGILYNAVGTTLITCPEGKSGSISIPEGVTTIDNTAFVRCARITDITLPSTITRIYPLAFSACSSLTQVTMNADSSVLGDFIFDGCSALNTLTFTGDAPSFSENTFGGLTATAYYPANNSTWTEDVRQNYGGTITWVPAGGSSSGTGNVDYIRLLPANGATDVGYTLTDPPVVEIEFSKEIVGEVLSQYTLAELDFTAGTLRIHKQSDDSVIYEIEQDTGVNWLHKIDGTYSFEAKVIDGKTLKIDFTNPHTVLEPGTEYYITVDAGFIKFTDGTICQAIEKGEWFFCTEGNNISQPTDILVKDGTFSYLSDLSEELGGDDVEFSYNYHYDESWFFNSSSDYQHGLVQMSIRTAMAAFATTNGDDSAKNIKMLMNDLGFSYTADSIHYPTPQTNSIGYAIGSKNIQNDDGDICSLVLVAIRGAGYQKEWGGNFQLGNSNTHDGFGIAAWKVKDGLEDYLNQHAEQMSDKIKVWIVGYSRAGATANLLAKSLNDGDIPRLNKDNIFAFCFECPQTTISWISNCTNIKNFVNPLDLVPKVAMSDWGYGRYGVTYIFPSKDLNKNYITLKNAMLEEYTNIISGLHSEYPELFAGLNTQEGSGQASILDDFMDNLAEEFISPDNYLWNHQEHIIRIAEKFLGGSSFDAYATVAEIIDILSLATTHPINTAATLQLFTKYDALKAHYSELCLAWIDSLEGFYTTTNGRKVFINCPVNISVYDSNNQLVAQIIDDVAQDIENGATAYIDDDGQKIILLPGDEEYTVQLTATDEGLVTYTISEYDAATDSVEKVVSYHQIDIATGEALLGVVENMETASNTYYKLYFNGDSLTPAITQIGSDVTTYKVDVSYTGSGTTYGGGRYISGEHAIVRAIATAGNNFDGWYVNGQLVSKDNEYRFIVTENITISAVFANESEETPHTHSGGTATCTQKAICSGCGEAYGDYAAHDYESVWSQGDANGHWHKCKNCNAHDTRVAHTPGAAATATTAQTCTVCGYVIKAATGSPTTETTKPEEDDEPIKYKITSGKNKKWRKGSDYGLAITVDAPQNKFVRVLVDGRILSSANYIVRSGSTIVTLQPFYLESLPKDKYTIRIEFDDGYAETTFTVASEVMTGMPFTGDNFNLAFWLGMNITSGLSLLAILVVFLRKRYLYRQTQE